MKDIIKVRNKSTYVDSGYKTILIDRTTRFGNPYKAYNEKERDMCIERYAYVIKRALMKSVPDFKSMFMFLENELYEAVKRNEPLILLCHCYPKKCHGDIIKQMLLNKYYEHYWFINEKCECCGHGEYKIGVYGI